MAMKRAASAVAREESKRNMFQGRESKGSMFQGRGLSNRTVDILANFGIDAPERLLYMTEGEIKKIPGVGKASLAEIMGYREQFMRQGG
jgi:DNA-directed RNA polymerase alpha subunit